MKKTALCVVLVLCMAAGLTFLDWYCGGWVFGINMEKW